MSALCLQGCLQGLGVVQIARYDLDALSSQGSGGFAVWIPREGAQMNVSVGIQSDVQ